MKENNNYFESSKEVKWCPGCGNYAILNSMQKTLASLNILNEKTVFISGIGCAGRFPYYMNTYGFHTLHGRAPAVATGLKMVRPDLNVWIVIGDGDGFSIGLSHTLHLIRRNLNIKVLFINNKIYSLTKGQYSPTSSQNFISKSSPYGSVEKAINPMLLALNMGCTFAARSLDTDSDNLKEIIKMSMNHKGTSFIEILQNCNIFNDGIYNNYIKKETKDDYLLYLRDNEEYIFGKNKDKILILDNLTLKIVDYNNKKKTIYHKTNEENILQIMLAQIDTQNKPLPVGIFRAINKECYEDTYNTKGKKIKSLNEVLDLF